MVENHLTDNAAPARNIKTTALKLLATCRANEWAGYDPYDALNSKIFDALPLLNFGLFRLALTQLTKRFPFNFRPLLLVPKTQNPKGLALFLAALLRMSRQGLIDENDDAQDEVEEKLISLRAKNSSYWCWGYSFPWQTRTILVARGEPNLVCTTFVANALLDAYKQRGESRFLHMAISAAEYILHELYWSGDDSIAGFGYPLPSLREQVHNANFLGAALLCRVYDYSGEKKFLEPALKVARYSAGKQHDDGSWRYGELPTQQWIDNFHTGYNLCALRSLGQHTGTSEFEVHVRRGFKFYQANFFREDGAPKYFHDRTYPIDIHSVAQSIITLTALRDLDSESLALALSVFRWAMAHMWDERGYFYYRVLRFGTIKISYMRWSQAWMFLALATLLENVDHSGAE